MSIFDDMLLPANKERFLEHEREKSGSHQEEFEAFDTYLRSEAFDRDVSALVLGEFWFDAPIKKQIRKLNTTRIRTVYVFPERERFILRYLSFMLHRYDDLFSPRLYSYCSGRRIPNAVKELRAKVDFDQDYVFQLDIASYGMSIDPVRLLPILKRVIADDPVLYDFFEKLLLRRQSYCEGQLVDDDTRSLPGMAPHSFLCNVYLSEVDRDFQDLAKVYFRYADDVLLVAPSKEAIDRLSDAYMARVEDLGLSINRDKTHIHPAEEAWTFLGLLFYGHGEIDISAVTVRKMKKRIRRRARRLRQKVERRGYSKEYALRLFILHSNLTFFGNGEGQRIDYAKRYFPIITRTESLAELDHYTQMYARYIMTGRFSKKNYNLRYDDLKKLGYRSLVHEYYQAENLRRQSSRRS